MQNSRSTVTGISTPGASSRSPGTPTGGRAIAFIVIVLTACIWFGTPASAQGRHADPELEALLPTALGGVALIVESQVGTELATDSTAFDAFLEGLGKTRADFSLASAYP